MPKQTVQTNVHGRRFGLLFAVVFGWLALGERLSFAASAGVVMIVLGVAWVVLERSTTPASATSAHRGRGIALALLAAACQAGGLCASGLRSS